MLVITRKKNEIVQIGKDIRVSVLNIDSDRVSIGIAAPRSIEILRGEHLEEARRINYEATNINKNISLADLGMFVDKGGKHGK